jgi:hypothetical protein
LSASTASTAALTLHDLSEFLSREFAIFVLVGLLEDSCHALLHHRFQLFGIAAALALTSLWGSFASASSRPASAHHFHTTCNQFIEGYATALVLVGQGEHVRTFSTSLAGAAFFVLSDQGGAAGYKERGAECYGSFRHKCLPWFGLMKRRVV